MNPARTLLTALLLTPLAALHAADAPVELTTQYDVVIAGAGTGGCGAAIQAARMGASVLLLEESDWIGGQMTAAAVTAQDYATAILGESGIYREFCERVRAHYRPLGRAPETAYFLRAVAMEPRVGQAILYAMIAETRRHGTLDISLRSTVAKVIKTDNTVTGVVVQSLGAQGIASREVGCRTLIDATEWGDVIPLTGARYRVGNCVSDSIQPEREIQHLTWTAVIRQYPGPVPPALRITSAPPGYTEAVEKKFAAMPKAGGTVQLPPYDPKNKPWTFASFIAYRAMPDSARPECGLALTSTPINYSDLVAYRAILAASPITRTHMNYENDYPVHIRDVEDPASRTKTCREAQLRTLHLLYYVQHTLGETGWSVADDEGFDTPFRRAEVAAWLQDSPELQSYRVILNHFSVMAYARESRRTTGLSTRSKAASAMAIRSPGCLSLPREASHLRQPPHILPRSFITTE